MRIAASQRRFNGNQMPGQFIQRHRQSPDRALLSTQACCPPYPRAVPECARASQPDATSASASAKRPPWTASRPCGLSRRSASRLRHPAPRREDWWCPNRQQYRQWPPRFPPPECRYRTAMPVPDVRGPLRTAAIDEGPREGPSAPKRRRGPIAKYELRVRNSIPHDFLDFNLSRRCQVRRQLETDQVE